MACDTAPGSIMDYRRMLVAVSDTLRQNINVKEIGDSLSEKGKLPSKLRRKVKAIAKTNDANLFYGVLTEFDLKSFVIFLQDLKSSKNEKHSSLYSFICTYIKDWIGSIKCDPENDEWIKELSSMGEGEKDAQLLIKYRDDHPKDQPMQKGSSLEGVTDIPTLTDDNSNIRSQIRVSLRPHESEQTVFERESTENYFYSQTHGVTVMAEQKALPHHPLTITLTVNDYTQSIKVPSDYDTFYSALISLKCEPQTAFLDFVSVTIPHCAAGDVDSLCILSGPEDPSQKEVNLEEDSDIEIEEIDEHYITFRTKHFTKYRAASVKKHLRKQKQCMKRSAKVPLGTANTKKALSCEFPNEAAVSFNKTRSYSLPTSKSPEPEQKFCAVMFRPKYYTSQEYECIFSVTYYLSTYIKELEDAVSRSMTNTEFKIRKSQAFVFSRDSDIIELHPESGASNGWTLQCSAPPAMFHMPSITEYLNKRNLPIPLVVYELLKGQTSSQTTFNITLHGSHTPLHRPVSFVVSCCEVDRHPPPIPSKDLEKIKIIRDMYSTNSSITEVLSGRSLEYVLSMDDHDCRVLFCEISFHLPNWENLANILNLDGSDIRALKSRDQSHNLYFDIPYSMFHFWLRHSDQPCTLQTLLDALKNHGSYLEVSTWNDNFDVCHLNVSKWQLLDMTQKVKNYWKCLARLLGETESDICAIESDCQCDRMQEKAYQMLRKWKLSTEPDSDMLLFKGLHCIREHDNVFHDILVNLAG